jgi:MFS superfamily sulfate permease-like transporter
LIIFLYKKKKGVLHVPINVPALGVSTNKDDVNVNRELVAHGISNAVSGLFGAVQSMYEKKKISSRSFFF